MKEHLEILKKELQNDVAQLLDVRERDEWNVAHLKDAISFPLSALVEGKIPDIDFKKKIYIHCRSGKRVYKALPILENMGGGQVIPLNEGLEELAQNGFAPAT